MWCMIATWRMALEGVNVAEKLLKEGNSSADAVEATIKETENCAIYKSVGYGGLPNEEMEVELDAAFMDGDTLSIGAICAIQNFANPISIARKLSEKEVNNMLVGVGANQYAMKEGFESKLMLTKHAEDFYNHRLEQMKNVEKLDQGHDTIGVVCLDSVGKVCSATSTSGMFMKEKGRVGDSPLVGSGFYADSKVGGATATGLGEDLMKGCISYEIVRLMKEGMHPQTACEKAVFDLDKELKERRQKAGDISVVAMNNKGQWGAASNIEDFSFVVMSENQKATVYRIQNENGVCKRIEASQQWIDEYLEIRMKDFVI